MRHIAIIISSMLSCAVPAAQAVDLNQILQRGINETVRSITTTPPAPVYKPPSPPPYSAPKASRPAPVQRKAPTKSAGALAAGANQIEAKSNNRAEQKTRLPTKAVTTSSLIKPIVLPIHDGLPIAYTMESNGMVPRASMQQLGLWLDLINLARYPELLDAPASALPIAKEYVAQEYWDSYFRCSTNPCSALMKSKPGTHPYYAIVAWKGENEFERARSHQSFIADYRNALAAEAAALPFDMYLATTATFGEYSSTHGGMPITWAPGHLHAGGIRPSARIDNPMPPAIAKLISLSPTLRADTRIALPQMLTCSPTECEKLLSQTTKRSMYVLLKLRVLAIDKPPGIGKQPRNVVESITPIALYARPELDTPFYRFPAVAVATPALLTNNFPAFSAGPMLLNSDTLYVLVLKHHKAGDSLLNHSRASQQRKELENSLHDLALEKGWPKVDPWGPFFPPLSLPAPPSDAEVIDKFQSWSRQRAQTAPSQLTLRFQTGYAQPKDYPPVEGKQRLIGPSMNMRLLREPTENVNLQVGHAIFTANEKNHWLKQADIGPAENLLLATFDAKRTPPGLSSDVVLAFPRDVYSYAMASSAPTSTHPLPSYASAELDKHVVLTEIEALIEKVSFVPSPRGEVMVIYIKPQQGRLYTQAGLSDEGPPEYIEVPTQQARPAPAMPMATPTAVQTTENPKRLIKAPPATNVATATKIAFPFDHDILGIRLGMPIDEAQAIARKHLEPELIYSLKSTDTTRGYKLGHVYVSLRLNEFIILAQTPDGKVAGVERKLTLPPQTPLEPIHKQLIDKYGEPQSKGNWQWWPQQPPAICVNAPPQNAVSTVVEGNEPELESEQGRKLWKIRPHAMPMSYRNAPMQNQQAPDLASCGPILRASFTAFSPGTEPAYSVMQLIMYDHGAYTRAQEHATPPATLEIKIKM